MVDDAIRSGFIYRNRGLRGDASLVHPHSQLIALDMTPPVARVRQGAMFAYYRREKRCLICDMLAYEQVTRSRIVNENDAFSTIVPFAAEVPCEMWLVPRHHQDSFTDLTDRQTRLLGFALRDALSRLDAILHTPAYNYTIETSAKRPSLASKTHWVLTYQASGDARRRVRVRIRNSDKSVAARKRCSQPPLSAISRARGSKSATA
jgi:UDPglucose--hexose-1-phosphate uridylyltransferase